MGGRQQRRRLRAGAAAAGGIRGARGGVVYGAASVALAIPECMPLSDINMHAQTSLDLNPSRIFLLFLPNVPSQSCRL